MGVLGDEAKAEREAGRVELQTVRKNPRRVPFPSALG